MRGIFQSPWKCDFSQRRCRSLSQGHGGQGEADVYLELQACWAPPEDRPVSRRWARRPALQPELVGSDHALSAQGPLATGSHPPWPALGSPH